MLTGERFNRISLPPGDTRRPGGGTSSHRTLAVDPRRASRHALAALLLAAALLALALTAVPASAGQVHLSEGLFCEPAGAHGTSPCEPSFSGSYGVAVHLSDGDVIVFDRGAKTIRRFKANGEPDPFAALGTNLIDGKKGPGGKECGEEPSSCDATPQSGFTTSSFAQENQIAVDSSGSATDGNLYLTQQNSAGLHLVDIFASSGSYRGQLTGTAEGPFGPNSHPAGVAVDPSGDVFVSDYGEKKIYKYTPSAQPPVNADGELFSTAVKNPGQLAAGVGTSGGALFASTRFGPTYKLGPDGSVRCEVRGGETSTIAVNPSDGHVLVSDSEFEHIGTYDYDASSCSESTPATLIARFDGSHKGVAANAAGRLYLTAEGQVEVFGPLIALPDPTTGSVSNIGETTATVSGTIKANGLEVSQCKFEYGTTTAYGSSKPCAETPAEIGTAGASVHADLTGLAPETLYHYRLVAANANGPANPQGEDRTFQTVSKPQLLGTWSESVALSEATLKAQLNPQSATTTYRFEWGLTEAPYEHAGAPVAIGSEPLAKIVGLPLSGLTPGTTYHFRVVAENHCHPESNPAALCTSEGPDTSFTTYLPFAAQTDCPNQALRSEASAFLPDCRAYEMVSPVDKNGGDIVHGGINTSDPASFTEATPDGNRITYTTLAGFGDLQAGVNFNQYLAGRSEVGWSNSGIHPPIAGHRVGSPLTEGFRLVYGFTPDLCDAWLIDFQTPAPAGGADGYPNLYRRHNCGQATGELEALTDVAMPAGTSIEYINRDEGVSGVSADGRHALFVAEAKLTPEAPEPGPEQKILYDRFGAAIHLVSILPNGTPAGGYLGGGSSGHNWQSNLASAVSENGERVYWNSNNLYLRLHPEQGKVAEECSDNATVACTIAVSKSVEPYFWAASANGARALYTEGSTEAGEAKLFEFDLGREEAEPTEASQKIAEKVEGVLGASRDLSRTYFVSRKKLAAAGANSAGEEAAEGAHNLYLYEAPVGGGEPRYAFVARLSSFDVGEEEPGSQGLSYSVTEIKPYFRAARVSPDGEALAFDSRAPLTGYDNTDTASGKPAVEVYLYDAASGSLRCASCNPSGARPLTLASMRQPYLFPWDEGRQTKVPVAAWLPTSEQSPYASRPLSADGARLFFNSYDALLPRDTNGALDVYEWEAPGTGDCSEQSPSYFAANQGCLYLISSGESPYESEFWDASEDGRDAFFTTESSLVPPDPGSVDLYDARAGGGFSYPTAAPSCEGEACQSPPAPPDDPTPASSAFEGAGNVSEAAKKPRCRKPKLRRHGRCVTRHTHRHRKGRTAR